MWVLNRPGFLGGSAQLVERLVVVDLPHMRQFVHHDHLQELRCRVLEQGGNADLAAHLQSASLHPRHRGVRPEGVLQHLQLAVVNHLAQGRRLAKVPVLQFLHVLVQLAIAANGVPIRILLRQHRVQPALLDQGAHPLLHRFGIANEVLQCLHEEPKSPTVF